jgi:hypothetical protein
MKRRTVTLSSDEKRDISTELGTGTFFAMMKMKTSTDDLIMAFKRRNIKIMHVLLI